MKKLEKLTNFLSKRYGIEVINGDVEIAEIFNTKIVINPNSRDEISLLFLVAHLFGHAIQSFNTDNEIDIYKKFKTLRKLKCDENDLKKDVYSYEIQAYQIGKGLLEMVFGFDEVDGLDEKLQIYMDTDFVLFSEYLLADNRVSVNDFNKILEFNYTKYKGKYPKKLKVIYPPESIKDAIIVKKKVY